MIDSSEKISPEEIIADTLVYVGDTGQKMLTPGFYRERLKQILFRLNTEFYLTEVVLDKGLPENKLIMELPKDFFNPKHIYIYNAGCCTPDSGARIVHYKTNFNNSPGGTNYSADRIENQQYDPYENPYLNPVGKKYTDVFWANVENGQLMLSSQCSGYKRIRIIYNSMGGDFNTVPLVPRINQRVVVDLMNYECCKYLIRRDPKLYTTLMASAKDDLYRQPDGSWWEFHKRSVSMDTWKRNDFIQRTNNARIYK